MVSATDSTSDSVTVARQIFVGPIDSDEDGLPDAWEDAALGGMGVSVDDIDIFGVKAILRFALGVAPGRPQDFPFVLFPTKGPMNNGDDNYFVIQFQRRRDLAGHTLSVECSTDLEQWDPVDAELSIIADDGVMQTVEVRVPRSGDPHKFFLIDVQ